MYRVNLGNIVKHKESGHQYKVIEISDPPTGSDYPVTVITVEQMTGEPDNIPFHFEMFEDELNEEYNLLKIAMCPAAVAQGRLEEQLSMPPKFSIEERGGALVLVCWHAEAPTGIGMVRGWSSSGAPLFVCVVCGARYLKEIR